MAKSYGTVLISFAQSNRLQDIEDVQRVAPNVPLRTAIRLGTPSCPMMLVLLGGRASSRHVYRPGVHCPEKFISKLSVSMQEGANPKQV